MYSSITIIGNLVRDADLKYSQNGTAVTTDAIAYTTGFGNNKETSFIDFVIFGKLGESLVKYLTKGTKVLISGELKQDQFVDKQGNKRSKYTVIVKDLRLLGSTENNSNNQSNVNNRSNNYNNQQQFNNNYQNNSQIAVDDEQIPF